MTDFKKLIDETLALDFDNFVTLYYPRPAHLRNATSGELMKESIKAITDLELKAAHYRRFSAGMDCQDEWLAKVKAAAPEGAFRYLKIMENRDSKRDFKFLTFLGGCEWDEFEFEEHWKPLWRQIAGGTAWKSEIDQRIGGLIRHFVFKTDCILETNDGMRYRADDFEK